MHTQHGRRERKSRRQHPYRFCSKPHESPIGYFCCSALTFRATQSCDVGGQCKRLTLGEEEADHHPVQLEECLLVLCVLLVRLVHRQRRRRRRLIVVGVVIVCITMISSCRWAPLCAAASDRRSGCHRGARRRWPCRLRLARTTRRRKLGHPVVDWVVASLVRQDGRGRTAADLAGDVTAISRESAGKHRLREKRVGATPGNGRSGG